MCVLFVLLKNVQIRESALSLSEISKNSRVFEVTEFDLHRTYKYRRPPLNKNLFPVSRMQNKTASR